MPEKVLYINLKRKKLKKLISLSEASKISGYHRDYLSALIRKNDLNGTKISGSWFTTQEELTNYSMKKKIRHNKWAFSEFLASDTRRRRILIWTLAILSSLLLAWSFNNKKDVDEVIPVNTNLSTEAEIFE